MTHDTDMLPAAEKTRDGTRGADARQPRKVYVKTYGCQMNVYDSDRMADALAGDGYLRVDTPEDADLYLINTCHIREKAAEKVYSELGRLQKQKRRRAPGEKDFLVGVTGCVAQAEGREIFNRAPVVDIVIGPQTYHRLPEAVAKAERGERILETDYAIEDKFEHLPGPDRKAVAARGVTAFLTVQEGCDKFCSFCVVPYTRGSEVSRPVAQIVREAEALVAAGVREITLLGQNVNAWHGEGSDGREWRLGELLYRLAGIDGVERLRYTTSHPRDMDDGLIAAHRDLPQLMPYLHLPVQSGSDRILKAMNRRHTADDYLRLIDRIRAARPDIALSGDFIVGFPGESDDDFRDTLRIIDAVGYAQAYSFKYSQRPGTPGAELGAQVEDGVKSARLEALQALLTRHQHAFQADCVGREVDLLLEKPGRREGQTVGRSPWLQPTIVDAKGAAIGDIIRVRITRTEANSLFAERVAERVEG
jgi:tRNA-2-methylthio-N6-dimethylallyladenosine synthase